MSCHIYTGEIPDSQGWGKNLRKIRTPAKEEGKKENSEVLRNDDLNAKNGLFIIKGGSKRVYRIEGPP